MTITSDDPADNNHRLRDTPKVNVDWVLEKESFEERARKILLLRESPKEVYVDWVLEKESLHHRVRKILSLRDAAKLQEERKKKLMLPEKDICRIPEKVLGASAGADYIIKPTDNKDKVAAPLKESPKINVDWVLEKESFEQRARKLLRDAAKIQEERKEKLMLPEKDICRIPEETPGVSAGADYIIKSTDNKDKAAAPLKGAKRKRDETDTTTG